MAGRWRKIGNGKLTVGYRSCDDSFYSISLQEEMEKKY